MLETHIFDIEYEMFASFQLTDEMDFDERVDQLKSKNFECHHERVAELRLGLIEEIKCSSEN